MKPIENRRLLFVEDDEVQSKTLCDYFGETNEVVSASTLARAKEAVRDKFDAVVLDVILPDGTGLDVIPSLPKSTPVIILSDLDSEDNILDGLEAGATDYIVKPCSPRLLEARLSLRLLPPEDAVITKHGLTVNSAMRTVSYRGTPIQLTSSEFNILNFLIRDPGKFYTATEIYEKVWHAPSLHTTTIKYHLHNLRVKLNGASMGSAGLILTEFGKGYAFAGDGADA